MADTKANFDQWQKLLARALITRQSAAAFGRFAQHLEARAPVPKLALCDLLIRPQYEGAYNLDNRIPGYLVELIKHGIIDTASVLRSARAWSQWQIRPSESENADAPEIGQQAKKFWKWEETHSGEAAIFGALTKLLQDKTIPKSRTDCALQLEATVGWIKLLATAEVQLQFNEDGIISAADQRKAEGLVHARLNFAALLVELFDNELVQETLRKECPVSVVKGFSVSLLSFVATLSAKSQATAQRLEMFRLQKLLPLIPVDKKAQAASDELNEMLATSVLNHTQMQIVELPVVNSRAGLYIYLNSLLVARPLMDDAAILEYLQNRYQGDTQSSAIDLIAAAFDVLANAIFSKASISTTLVLRSFLVNKIPLLLSVLSTSMYPPLTAEFCISQALANVDTNAFPTFSSMFEQGSSGNMFGDSVRQDFCFSACLHGLIEEQSIERLLGEIPMQTLPAGGRYINDELFRQCVSDHKRTESLIDEIERMDGNVAAACQVVAEMVIHLCRSRETMALKSISIQLAKKPSTLDIMLLFVNLTEMLQPLCGLLDGWHHDEDLGEYQPVYEEFGGILLLVAAFKYRYDLSPHDLGIQSNDSFVARWLVKGALANTNELSEEQDGHLNGWIKGLFTTEGGGLGDEPMSACPPQNFYLLVPTLFHQSLLARLHGHIDDEVLKGGLEYLVETSLLPSLVGALFWIANHIWEDHKDAAIIVTMLQCLMQPSSSSSEASTMLSSILNVTANDLEQALRHLQVSEPQRQDITPLLRILTAHPPFARTDTVSHTELEAWTSPQAGGLFGSIKTLIRQFVQFSASPGTNIMPTAYSHKMFLVTKRMLGAKRVLQAIIEEVQSQTAIGAAPLALDAAVAIICAPDASTFRSHSSGAELENQLSISQHRISLRTALKYEVEGVVALHKTDVARAETILRLSRRVEAQMQSTIASAMEVMGLQTHIGGLDGVDDAAQAQIDEAVAAAGVNAEADLMAGLGAGISGGINMLDLDGMGDVAMTSMSGMSVMPSGDDLLDGMDISLDF